MSPGSLTPRNTGVLGDCLRVPGVTSETRWLDWCLWTFRRLVWMRNAWPWYSPMISCLLCAVVMSCHDDRHQHQKQDVRVMSWSVPHYSLDHHYHYWECLASCYWRQHEWWCYCVLPPGPAAAAAAGLLRSVTSRYSVSLTAIKHALHTRSFAHWFSTTTQHLSISIFLKLTLPSIFMLFRWHRQPYLSDLLQHHEPTRSLRSSSSHQLAVPRHKLTFGSRAFRFSAPRVWNSLPVSIRETKSLPTFRRHLKTLYF